MTTPDLKLSRLLNTLAGVLDEELAGNLGGRASFVLLVQAEGSTNVQYVANVKREDGVKLVQSLLERWGNPATVSDLPEHQKHEMLLKLLERCKVYHEALDTAFAMLIAATRPGDGREPFMPSQSPMWPAMVEGRKATDDVEAALAFSRELAVTGPIAAPDPKERH